MVLYKNIHCSDIWHAMPAYTLACAPDEHRTMYAHETLIEKRKHQTPRHGRVGSIQTVTKIIAN